MSQNDIELHLEQVWKKWMVLWNDYSLSSRCTPKNETLGGIKNAGYNDL